MSKEKFTVPILGLAQIFTWGSSYYLIAIIMSHVSEEMAWKYETISLGLSLALLISGFSAPAVGRFIQTYGGRSVLAVGMIIISAGLVLLGNAHSLVLYYLSWVLLGIGMSAGLYDAAFATLGSIFGKGARKKITQLTLIAGFSSTLCWPISYWMVDAFGWRGACFSYAAILMFLMVPLVWFHTPNPVRIPKFRDPTKAIQNITGRFWNVKTLCVATIGVQLTLLSTIWAANFVALLSNDGFSLQYSIFLGALVGPAQVAGRFLELLAGGRYHRIWTMLLSTLLILIGFIGLWMGFLPAIALLLYGAGNGLWSIARGIVPLSIFDADIYPIIVGKLARPMLFSGAVGPLLGSFLITRLGSSMTYGILCFSAGLAVVASMVLLVSLRTGREVKMSNPKN